MPKVEWSFRARNDLEQLARWIWAHSPQAAGRVVPQIEKAAAKLERFPLCGPETDVPGVRRLVIPTTPFILLYLVQPHRVVVLRVFHHAQPWATDCAP